MKLVDPMRYVSFKATGRLPSPKGLILAIVLLLQRDDYKIEDLVQLVQSDPAIAGELLKYSNSVTFGRANPIVSLPQAVMTLGGRQVRVIVTAFSVLNDHRNGKCTQFDYEKFWSRSLATAISAQALAPYAKLNAEENFTAGLLCSLGELALASIFPDRYGEIISQSYDSHKRIELEFEAFGSDHRELNATLLQEWGMPLELVNAIYHCEHPDEAEIKEGSLIHKLTLSLHVALAFADICVAESDASRGAMLSNLYFKAAKLEISQEETNSIADGIIASWQEWGSFLKIQTQEISSIADLIGSTIK